MRASGFRSAQQLHDQLRDDDTQVGLATVYRALQSLAEAEEVDVIHSSENEALYRICPTTEHHHHLVCRSCRHSVEVDSLDVERWTHRVADQHGFTSTSHVVELFGLCEDCAEP